MSEEQRRALYTSNTLQQSQELMDEDTTDGEVKKEEEEEEGEKDKDSRPRRKNKR